MTLPKHHNNALCPNYTSRYYTSAGRRETIQYLRNTTRHHMKPSLHKTQQRCTPTKLDITIPSRYRTRLYPYDTTPTVPGLNLTKLHHNLTALRKAITERYKTIPIHHSTMLSHNFTRLRITVLCYTRLD